MADTNCAAGGAVTVVSFFIGLTMNSYGRASLRFVCKCQGQGRGKWRGTPFLTRSPPPVSALLLIPHPTPSPLFSPPSPHTLPA